MLERDAAEERGALAPADGGGHGRAEVALDPTSRQPAVRPLSTDSTAPWMVRASSEATKLKRAAISSASAIPEAHVGGHQVEVDVVGHREVGGQGGVHAARGDGVHPERRLDELHGEGLGELHDSALRHAVGDGVGLAHQPRVGGDVDDVALGLEAGGGWRPAQKWNGACMFTPTIRW